MTNQPQSILSAVEVSCSRTVENDYPSYIRNLTISFQSGTLNILSGNQGCGKNLLLRLLGLLEKPDSGDVLLKDISTRQFSEEDRATHRNQHFGFLFTAPFLLPSLSVLENVAMPLFKISSPDAGNARPKIEAVLDFVGLTHCKQSDINDLTLYQQHQVSLARALVNQPECLIAENLDANLPEDELFRFLEILQRTGKDLGTTTIMTSLNHNFSRMADRNIEIADGVIRSDSESLKIKQEV